MKNIHIPNPCSENWELMTSQEKGKFCDVCNKCVIDFTQKAPEEIQQIFKDKKEDHLCGRFYNHQLTNSNSSSSEKIKARFFKYIPSFIQNNKITGSVLAFILFLTGCSKPKDDTCSVTTGVLVADTEPDTIKNTNYVLGEPLMQNDSVAKMPKKDSIKLKRKK